MTEEVNAPESLRQARPRDMLDHVQGLLRAKPPGGDFLVPGSTPVVAFGDILQARVATLGINPSVAEFSRGGVPITPRRLATVESLGLDEGEAPNLEHARELLHDCRTYYARNPYWRWFRALERILSAATGESYTSCTACHLDLVPWATDPVWGRIPSRQGREDLLNAGLPYLQYLLRHLDLRLVLMNGRQVVNQVASTGLGDLTHLDTIPYDQRGSTTMLYAGEGNGVLFLGWSVNLQGTPGANSEWFRERLASWIRGQGVDLEPPQESQESHPASAAPSVSLSEHDLLAHLRGWLETSDAETLAPIADFGGRAVLRATIGATEVVINADTKRAAVEELVESADKRGLRWRVIANRSGRVNKVVFRLDGSPTPGWYCYSADTLPQELDL